MKKRFKFICYVALMTFVYAALGAFLAFLCFMFLGHTTVAALRDTLRLTPTQFLMFCGILGAGLGFWIGWNDGGKQFLLKADGG